MECDPRLPHAALTRQWSTCNHRPAQIAKRRREHLAQNPDARIISLGIGDTTEPIPPFISEAMANAARDLGTSEGYSG